MTPRKETDTMTTQKMKAVHTFLPISRVNDDERTVEAYGFVNEVVKGEGGICLKRTSMEAATPDYMKWANIREMHRSDSAVGTTQSVKWDKTGAHMTLRVSDDAAWQKVKDGVYKGLSVGVIPEVMRGKDVEKCCWMETSLVDRPADPDAKITVFRADGFDPEAEHDVVMLDAPASPVMDMATAFAEEFELIRTGETKNKEKLARKAIRRLLSASAPLLGTGTQPNVPAPKEPKPMKSKDTPPPAAAATTDGEGTILARMEAFETKTTAEITRLKKEITDKDKAFAKLQRKAEKKSEKASAKSAGEIKRLSKAAVPSARPVLYPQALERSLDPGSPYGNQSNAPDAQALKGKYDALVKEGTDLDPRDPNNSSRRSSIVDEIQMMKPLLASVGVEV